MKRHLAAATLALMLLRLGVLAGLAGAESPLIDISIMAPVSGEPAAETASELSISELEVSYLETAPEPEILVFPEEPVPTDEISVSPAAETTPVPEQNEGSVLETTISRGVDIDNATGFSVDTAELLAEPLTQRLPEEGPQILIIHTHSSEAYTPDEENQYQASDVSRTEDSSYNVIRVGDELCEALQAQGLNVLHDREIYDYPSYTGSYSRSAEAVERHLAEYPDIAVVIDLHRDALGDGDVVYKTVAHEGNSPAAQVLLLVGTGENGLYHPNWRENLKLALRLQQAVVSRYPTLARPVALKQERYNQQLTTGSLLLEVGSSGNTLPEALEAVRLFAECAGPVLLELAASG